MSLFHSSVVSLVLLFADVVVCLVLLWWFLEGGFGVFHSSLEESDFVIVF